MTPSRPEVPHRPNKHRPLTRRARAAARAARNKARSDKVSPEDFGDDRERIGIELVRLAHAFGGNRDKRWRDCAERVCRRARCCRAPHVRCSNPKPRPERTPQQQAETKALLYRIIQERMRQEG